MQKRECRNGIPFSYVNTFMNMESQNWNSTYNKKKIRFNYYKYELNPTLNSVNTGVRTVSPYAIIYQLQEMYVVSLKDGKKTLYTYRIDRMKNIEIIDEKVNESITNDDIEKFVKSTVSMFGNSSQEIEVICDNQLLDNVVDLFGESAIIKKYDNNRFKLSLNKDIEGFKRYVLTNLDMIEVIKPSELKKEIEKIINKYLNK